jgi:signal transduction histidine kinase
MEWPEYIDLLTTASRWTRERDRLQDNLRRRIEITGALTAGFLWGGGLLGLAGVGWITRQRIVYRRTMRRMRDEILRDMHDDVGSGLGAVAILSQIGADEANLPDQTRSDLAEINQLAREMNDAIRDMAWLSRAEGDRLRPLADSCRDIARTLLPGLDVRIEPTERAPERRLPLRVRRDMLLFAKETLHNIARHARAGTVRVRLDASDGVMRLSIEDDGIGFDPRTVAEGTGLRSMRHRADSMNGRLTVDSRPGDGARLTLEVPLP